MLHFNVVTKTITLKSYKKVVKIRQIPDENYRHLICYNFMKRLLYNNQQS